MTPKQAIKHVGRLTYKPNFVIHPHAPEFYGSDGLDIHFEMFVPNVTRLRVGDQAAVISGVADRIHFSDDDLAFMTERGLFDAIYANLKKMEDHELDEWFAVDGKQRSNPHHAGHESLIPYWQDGEPKNIVAGSEVSSSRRKIIETVIDCIKKGKVRRQTNDA